MALFSPKHYVYVILSWRGIYVGKGSGNRIRESMKERHGIACFKIRRCFTSSGAYRTESRLIRRCRRSGIALQNGRAPNSSLWRRLSPRSRRRPSAALRDRFLGCATLVGLGWWLLA